MGTIYKHIDIIKLPALSLMYRRNNNLRVGNITKILYRRLKDELSKVCQVFAFIGLLKEADALLHIYKALTLGIFVKRFSLGHFPNVITHHRRM